MREGDGIAKECGKTYLYSFLASGGNLKARKGANSI